MFDQNVDIRREGIRILALKEPDGARILLPAKNQLRLALPFVVGRPHGHRHAHQHSHDAEAHEQRGHGIAGLAGSVFRPATLT